MMIINCNQKQEFVSSVTRVHQSYKLNSKSIFLTYEYIKAPDSECKRLLS